MRRSPSPLKFAAILARAVVSSLPLASALSCLLLMSIALFAEEGWPTRHSMIANTPWGKGTQMQLSNGLQRATTPTVRSPDVRTTPCYTHTRTHARTHTHTRTHAHTHTHTHIYIYIYIYTHTSTCTCTYTHIQKHIHVYIYVIHRRTYI